MGLKTTLIALILGFTALSQADVSPAFVRGAIERGQPRMRQGFSGIEWACQHGRMTCWAGAVYIPGDEPQLTTGRHARGAR